MKSARDLTCIAFGLIHVDPESGVRTHVSDSADLERGLSVHGGGVRCVFGRERAGYACRVRGPVVFDPIEPSPGNNRPSRSGRTLLLLAVLLVRDSSECCNRPQRATLRGFLLPLSTTFTTAGRAAMACRPGKPPAIALSRPGVLRVARGALARAGWYFWGVPAGWSLEAHERDFAR